MIDLYLTYEESKKILEIGYDFSPVSKSAEALVSRKGLQELITVDTNSWGWVLDGDIIMYGANRWSDRLLVSYVPLVPKAALEACLPKKVGIDNLYFRKFYKTTYSEEEFEVYQAGVNELESNAVIFSSSSIYEMFIWLHENYPEELKKKFDEVMA